MEIKDEIRKLLESDKLIIGTEKTLKELRAKNLEKVYVASNTKEETVNDIKHFASLAEVEVVELDVPNDEVGTICRKPFAISVLGVKAQ